MRGQECIDPLWWINQLISQVNYLIQFACNKYGSTNKSPTKLKCSRKEFDTVICLRIRKTYTVKIPQDDFNITSPENSLLSQQAVTSKGILVPYINL